MQNYRVITSSLRMSLGIFLAMLPILIFARFSSLRAQEVATLESGRTVECEVGSGSRCTFQISMSAGQYASVIVKQIGINVRVELLATNGDSVEYDSEVKTDGQEPVGFAATAAGIHRLTVSAKYERLPPGRCEVQLIEKRLATENEQLLQEAQKLRTEVRHLYEAGEYDRALPLAEKALALREQAGADQPAQARAQLMLALILYVKGNYPKADELAQRSLVMSESTLGSSHPQVANALNLLGLICRAEGQQARGISLVERALSIQEKAFGADHPELVTSLTDLALLYRDRGDFVSAEPAYKRALAISERAFGDDTYETGRALDMIANFYRELGNYREAEPLYLRALSIWEKTRGVNHPAFAVTLNNLANLYRNQGAYEKAEPLYQRALFIKEKALGTNHPDVARYRENLGHLYYQQGNYAKAEPLFLSALATWEKVGPDHPMVARNLRNLALLYYALKDYQKAEACYYRALNIYETTFGPNYYFLATILTGMSKTSLAQDKYAEALNQQARANAIADYNLNLNLAIGSERQKLDYLSTLPEQLNRTISLHARFGADDVGAAELALTTLLQRKGRVQDALSDSLASLHSRLSGDAQALLDELNDVTSQLARLVLNGRLNASLIEYQKRIKVLEDKRESLEAEVSRRSAGHYLRSQAVTLDAVRAALPENAALVEFAVYRPLDPKASVNRTGFGNPSYVAYVLRRQGQVQGKDLGPVREIDQAIGSFRRALRDPKRQDVQKLARVVNDSVIKPISSLLGDATQLLISPDGALNLIPFEALVDEQDRYLITRYSISYLTSGRDLLRLQLPRSSLSAPLVMANPLFGGPQMIETSKADAPKINKVALDPRRQGATDESSVSYMYFAPLNVTEQEAQTIKSLFGDADVKTGLQANESWLKHATAPRILHIATHGFFLQDPSLAGDEVANANADDRPQTATRGINANAKIENPLLRSGLALAGANLRRSGDDDGILTALEASGLNLWGTRLVTLSGCDTGLGELKNGEGVYGLRRAFVLAGTETLVMGLWPVSDYATRELMTGYYQGLKRGLGRREALREVQLAMIARKDRRHPFYWASFIQLGEWANLDGKR